MQPLPDDDFCARHGSWPAEFESRDARLVMETVLDLTDDDRTRHQPVRVGAQNDVVILTGTVGSWAARDAAAAVARRTPGARDLCNALQVADEAHDASIADQFDGLAARLAQPPAPGNAALSRPPRSRLSRLTEFLMVLAWCLLPFATIVGHLPIGPVLLAVLAVTVVGLLPSRSSRRH